MTRLIGGYCVWSASKISNFDVVSGMIRTFEFWYDVVCPYAYLGSTQVEQLEKDTGAKAIFKPFLLGGVFKSFGDAYDPNAQMAAAKQAHNRADMKRWAHWFGVSLQMPPEHPRRTVLAMRAILAAPEEARRTISHALFHAYWVHGLDVADVSVVATVLDECGVNGPVCVERASQPTIKTELRTRTDQAIELGIFGAPAFVVGGELFWGQDRIDFVRSALTS